MPTVTHEALASSVPQPSPSLTPLSLTLPQDVPPPSVLPTSTPNATASLMRDRSELLQDHHAAAHPAVRQRVHTTCAVPSMMPPPGALRSLTTHDI
ncbi:hypothetical protein PYCCODRAFT_1471874 [Trametes coccinea BRFM310]|uniref:Uncharacterized protein n=1 Tax=Trametes coccinea (strain BRFM310) TaxID=1353009 RepID=A0A1Y2IAB2_TRAC3|nr:hypothetical protein PYCCODRAFT_1471874 [Trametes coccinea BRFM310]